MSKHRCPICSSDKLMLRREASYVYSYVIDDDAPGLNNMDAFQSFRYDKREAKDGREYVECESCGSQYPVNFILHVLEDNEHIQ